MSKKVEKNLDDDNIKNVHEARHQRSLESQKRARRVVDDVHALTILRERPPPMRFFPAGNILRSLALLIHDFFVIHVKIVPGMLS